jgi:hypothetical protein
LFGHVSCGVVRFYVAKYSQAAAERPPRITMPMRV